LFHSSIKTLDAKYLEKKSGAASPNTNTNVANFLQTVLRSCPLLNKPNAIAHALEQSPQLQPLVLQIIHTFMQSQKQVIYLLDVFFSLQATKENGLSQMVVVWTDPFLVLQFFLHRCLQELIRTLEENERISLGTLESLPTLHLPSAPVPPPVSHAVQEEIVHKIWNSMIHEWAFIPYPLENVGVVYATKIEREKQAQAGYIKYLSLDSLSHRDNGSLLSFLDRFAKPVISPVAKSLMSAMAEISVRLEKIEEMMHVCLKAKNDKTTTTATTTTAPATAATTTTSVAEILRLTMNPSSNDPKSLTQGPLIPPETKSTGSDKTKVENRVTPRGPQELGLVNSGSRKDTGSKIESLGKKNEKSTPPTTSAPTSIATSLAASSANNNKAPDAREAMEAYLKKLNRKDLLPELKR
jgi:hypothetical protein